MQNLRGIYVIWLREILRFFREKPRIIAALAQPAAWLFIVGHGLGRSFSGPPGVDYIQYMFPGVIGMTVLFTSVFSAISIVWDREFGFLKEILVAPVSRSAVVFGKALSGSTTAVLQGIMVMIFAPLVGVSLGAVVFLQTLGIMFLLSLALSFFGIAIAARMESFHGFQLVVNFLVMPMFFLSGAIFPLKGLPSWLEFLALINPLAYGVDALRYVILGIQEFSLLLDLGVLALTAIVFMSIAVILFNREG